MQVAFWSPNHGQTGTTTATMAYGCEIAMTSGYKVLLAHSQFQRSTMEQCLIKTTNAEEDPMTFFRDHGMSALRRLAKNGRLSQDMIKDYTTSLLSGMNLDLLEGVSGDNHPLTSEETELLRRIYRVARQAYDMIFVDIHSGMNMDLTQCLIEDSDLVVVCLNQNTQVIEQFMKNKNEQAMLKGKKLVYHIARYDKNSKYRLKNLKRLYKWTEAIGLPYCTGFMDACNQHLTLDFLLRHHEAKTKDSTYEFIKALKDGSQSLVSLLELLEQEVYEQYG